MVAMSAHAADAVLDRMCEGVSRYWQTAFTNEVRVPWAACPSATSATLKTIGSAGETTAAIVRSGGELETSHFLAVPPDEDVYTLELTYLGAGDAVLEVVTGKVAFVKSATLGASVDGIAVDASATKPWSRTTRPGTTGDRVVFGYEAGWIGDETAAGVSIVKQRADNSLSDPAADGGWVAWNLRQGWGFGWFDVSLVGEGGSSLSASVWRPNDSLFMIMK